MLASGFNNSALTDSRAGGSACQHRRSFVDYLTPITRRILLLMQAYCQHQLSEMRTIVQNDRAKYSANHR